MIKTCIIPCLMDGAEVTTASYRIRAQAVAKYWPDADLWPDLSLPIYVYDAYIFQKAYLSDQAQWLIGQLRAKNKLMAFDICDPDWLTSEAHRVKLLKVLPKFDFATVPTYALKRWLDTYVPTHVIPDRLDLDDYPEALRHEQSEGRHPSCVWFGYSHNAGPLEELWPTIEKYDLPVTILSDRLPTCCDWHGRVRFVRWTAEGANREIAKHDIALVPRMNEYKSNNRTLTAWALGLATAENERELEALIDPIPRRAVAMHCWGSARERADVRLSVAAWKGLLEGYMERNA